jgi:hypothetical protein
MSRMGFEITNSVLKRANTVRVLDCAATFIGLQTLLKRKNLRGLSPRANYTDRVTAACAPT